MTEQALADAILRHTLQILRLSAGEEARVTDILAELERELRLLLAGTDIPAATRRDIEALIRDADEAINAGYLRAGAAVDTHRLAVIVAEKTQELMQDEFGVDIRLPSDATLLSVGRDVLIDGAPSSAWWARQALDLQFRFAAQVRQGIMNSETQEQIVRRIVGRQVTENGARRFEPGIMETSRRSARALVHSSVLAAANRARFETFRRNSRILDGVRWLATLDGRTCVRCMAYDGQAWNFDGERLKGATMDFALPPLHWSCRCVITVIPRGGYTPAARASKDEPTGAPSFDAFLSRQSDAFINAALGRKRAELYRKGGLTLRDFVSGTGRELTLDELKLH